MVTTRVTVDTEAAFDAAVFAHAGKAAALLVLFAGARDQPDGSSWCPDTNDAAPVIDSALAAARGDVTLIDVRVARAAYKGNASFWARTHSAVQLQRIPTLYRWGTGDRPLASLVEAQAKVPALVALLVTGE